MFAAVMSRWPSQAQGNAGVATIICSCSVPLARRLTTILLAMTLAESIETTRLHRAAGLTGDRTALVATRPFRAPTTPSQMRG